MPKPHLILERCQGESAYAVVPPSTVEQIVEVRIDHVRNQHNPRVKLGFIADRSIKVHRAEVYEEILAKQAAKSQ